MIARRGEAWIEDCVAVLVQGNSVANLVHAIEEVRRASWDSAAATYRRRDLVRLIKRCRIL